MVIGVFGFQSWMAGGRGLALPVYVGLVVQVEVAKLILGEGFEDTSCVRARGF